MPKETLPEFDYSAWSLERQKGCQDVLSVGPEKPLGYASLNRIETELGISPIRLAQELTEKGLETIYLQPGFRGFGTFNHGALFVYDPRALQNLLDEGSRILSQEGWPLEAAAFVWMVITTRAPAKTLLCDLVADSFGDPYNPCRTDRKSAW